MSGKPSICSTLTTVVKAFLAGYSIEEVPSTWRDRTSGESRFRLWKWLPLYLHWYFHAFRPKSRVSRGPRRSEQRPEKSVADVAG